MASKAGEDDEDIMAPSSYSSTVEVPETLQQDNSNALPFDFDYVPNVDFDADILLLLDGLKDDDVMRETTLPHQGAQEEVPSRHQQETGQNSKEVILSPDSDGNISRSLTQPPYIPEKCNGNLNSDMPACQNPSTAVCYGMNFPPGWNENLSGPSHSDYENHSARRIFDNELMIQLDGPEDDELMKESTEAAQDESSQEHHQAIRNEIMVTTIPPITGEHVTPSLLGSTRNRSWGLGDSILSSGLPGNNDDLTENNDDAPMSNHLEHANVVCFGWISHHGTTKWRDKVNELARDREGYPSWNDAIAEEVHGYLQLQERISKWYIDAISKEESGSKKRKLSTHGVWRLATAEEFVQKTRQRFLDERKLQKSKLWKGLLDQNANDTTEPLDERKLQKSKLCKDLLDQNANDTTEPQHLDVHEVRAESQWPAVRQECYPSDKHVCFDWNRHPGTKEWLKLLEICSTSGLYPEWDDGIPGYLKERLKSLGYGPFLVSTDTEDKRCPLSDGLWVHARDDEIATITKEQFYRNRGLLKAAPTDPNQGSTSSAPLHAGGPPTPTAHFYPIQFEPCVGPSTSTGVLPTTRDDSTTGLGAMLSAVSFKPLLPQCPRLCILWPESVTRAPAWHSMFNKRSLLYFLCAHDKSVVDAPITIKAPKRWAQKAVHILQFTIFSIRMHSAVGRIPFPLLPNFIPGNNAMDQFEHVIRYMESLLEDEEIETIQSWVEECHKVHDKKAYMASKESGIPYDAYYALETEAAKANNNGWMSKMELANNGDTVAWVKKENVSAWTHCVEDHPENMLLQLACKNGNEAEVTLLLEKGANINAEDNDGNTPLHLACKNGNEAIVQLLLEKGADVDSKDNNWNTPLHLACKNGDEAVVQLLLEQRANTNVEDNDGNTPLHLAYKNGNNEAIVKFLLENGAY